MPTSILQAVQNVNEKVAAPSCPPSI
jgi:hypothetical protein